MVDVAGPPSAQLAAAKAGRAARLRRWWPVGAALAAGALLLLAFPPYDWWWMAPVGVAALAAATYGRPILIGAGLGLLAGMAVFVPLLRWTGYHIGSIWLLLPVLESLYFAGMGAFTAAGTRVLQRWRWTWPLGIGGAWVLQEALRDRTPFGGFPWGRLAFSQGDSPLLGLAALGGAPLVTFGTAALGGLLVLVVSTAGRMIRSWAPRQPRPTASGVRGLAATLATAAVVLSVPLVISAPPATAVPVRVAIVQGNVPRLGLDFNAQRRAVLDNHVNATIALARDVAAGRVQRPDFVVWPENASDVDPFRDPIAQARIDEAAAAIGVPILVGGLTHEPGEDGPRNIGLVWDPATGPGQRYDKRHPVPFAEHLPLRSLIRLITPGHAALLPNDFVAGTVPGVLEIAGTPVGDVICFEVAYDDLVRDTVTGGAKIIVVQTNNATFDVAEARQQLAMVRLRAVEHGRPALMASTVGVSAFVDADGSVHEATGFFERAVISREVRPSASLTIATRLGVAPELVLVAMAVSFLLAAVALARARPLARTGPLIDMR